MVRIDTLTVLGVTFMSNAVNGFFIQSILQENSLLEKAIESLGLQRDEIMSSLPSSLKNTWSEMPLLFPKEVSDLQFVSKPSSHVTKKKDWDFIVRKADIDNCQLRVNKIKDPRILGIDSNVVQYSGYLDVEDEDKHFFYWFFESRNDPKNDPVVLWLNGGPGCSSLTGLFFELGPSSIGSDIKPHHNPYSWNSNASVIFLDQPVNVGYSYSSSGVSNTVAASKDIYAFLQLFFEQFPEYASGQDFHIAGESYAGHYIPVFATEILSHPSIERNFNLTSIMIGNGLTDPLNQYPYYEPMACGKGGEPAVLKPEQCSVMQESLPRCLSLIQSCYDYESVWTCVPASIYCNNVELGSYQQSGRNVYDIRKKCKGELCYSEMNYMDKYLNLDFVKEAVGAEVDDFKSCNLDINRNFLFAGDWMKPYHKHVTELLQQGLPVLIYAGDKDFICNWLGNQAWTDNLPWDYSEDFSKQPIRTWVSQTTGKKAGEVKNYKNFTFLRVYDGGHMLPFDMPVHSLDMFTNWIQGNYSFV